jgi:hypothetical protein
VIARSTRSRVPALTRSGRFRTFDTVPSDTPARAATSFMLGAPTHAIMPCLDVHAVELRPTVELGLTVELRRSAELGSSSIPGSSARR